MSGIHISCLNSKILKILPNEIAAQEFTIRSPPFSHPKSSNDKLFPARSRRLLFTAAYFDLCLIFRRLRFRRLIRFFFHLALMIPQAMRLPARRQLGERAEKVGESLSAIQARLAKENRSDFYARHEPAMAPKSKLVDDVQTHLSQVQESLHSKLTQTATARRPLLLTASKPSTPTKALTPRNHTTPIKPSTPLKQFSPTRHILASSPKQTTSIKPVTPSPRRITSTKLLTPSPRSFTPSKPLTPALSPYGRRVGSPMKPKQVYPKTGMVEIVKDDLRSRAAFGRKETKSLVRDSQTRHWARKTSTHYELDLEHLR